MYYITFIVIIKNNLLKKLKPFPTQVTFDLNVYDSGYGNQQWQAVCVFFFFSISELSLLFILQSLENMKVTSSQR